MDPNRDSSPSDISQSDSGTPTSRLSPPSHEQASGSYVPPELRPTGASYTGAGEPTRQWNAPPPPPQNPPPNPYANTQPPPPPQYYTQVRDERPRRAPILGPFLLIA